MGKRVVFLGFLLVVFLAMASIGEAAPPDITGNWVGGARAIVPTDSTTDPFFLVNARVGGTVIIQDETLFGGVMFFKLPGLPKRTLPVTGRINPDHTFQMVGQDPYRGDVILIGSGKHVVNASGEFLRGTFHDLTDASTGYFRMSKQLP